MMVGVRQGCVLAPVIFNLFLAAVSSVIHREAGRADMVTLRYRLDGSLFNLRRLTANTKVSHVAVAELEYADDVALVSPTSDGLQRSLDIMARSYTRAGLVINTEKTEVMVQQDPMNEANDHTFRVGDEELKTVTDFVYLGANLSNTCQVDNDIYRRIGKASAAFGRLSTRVFFCNDLTIKTKVAVYVAVCLSTLLYGCEAWVLYRRHLKKLESFHIRCLMRILNLKWWHKIPHTEVRRRAGVDPLEAMLFHRHLRWVGHVIRMPEDRIPRQVLYGELQEGRRSVGGQRKRHKDVTKATMKGFGIDPSSLEREAQERAGWRRACAEGRSEFVNTYNRRAAVRLERRHAASVTVVNTQNEHICPTCGRICASRIGLLSHSRTHQPRPQPGQ